MGTMLTDVHAWAIAAGLAAAMVAGWGFGWWWGSRTKDKIPPSKFSEACMAVLGLLLAFTFSLSLAKHDQRRQMVVADSNSIGDFYTCASLLKEPLQGKLRAVIRAYTEQRLALAGEPLDEAKFQEKLEEIQHMQDRMQALVKEAVDDGTPLMVPLVNTLNALTSNHASRLFAFRDRLPPSIVLLLVLSAVIAMVLMGNNQAESGERHFGATLGFVALVCLVMGVTLDLNQPQRGVITVSQEPMQRVLSGMGK